jgi:hypothetical protein
MKKMARTIGKVEREPYPPTKRLFGGKVYTLSSIYAPGMRKHVALAKAQHHKWGMSVRTVKTKSGRVLLYIRNKKRNERR